MDVAPGLQQLLGLDVTPVAVAVVDELPADVARVDESAAAGCGYWKRAAQGEVFATVAVDHFGCPIGAYTHGVELPVAEAEQQQTMIDMMVELEYVRRDEVPEIPHHSEGFGAVVYSPIDQAPCPIDAVVVQGTPRQMMILVEAANAAGLVGGQAAGRPTCAAIPEVMQEGRFVTNLGCIGNRVYTGIADDQLYVVLPGDRVNDVHDKLSVIVNANSRLEAYHGDRLQCCRDSTNDD
ncbi:MAG: DUF169 domain-containing protein [Planctomycetaceae bacterium]|nr:DUF169 domain-containing protein [Planctomycetaceae bacterium]